MKIVLHYRASDGFQQILAEMNAANRLVIVDEDDEAAFIREIADANALLHVLKPVTSAMIRAAPKLKLIQKIGVGVNTIDLDAAETAGIAVANMPGTNSQAVAEQTLALMFAVLRRLPYLDQLTRSGQGWHPDAALLDSCGEICGRTVGFFGMGSIPQALAPVITALGGKVVYTATKPKPDLIWQAVDMPTLLATSDILSLHAPLTPATRHFINAQSIARMKQGAILINTARGGLVDEAALHAALVSGKLAGAGLDVFAEEPAPADNPLFALPNVALTPHLAWLTPETLRRSMGIAFENCRRIDAGEPLLNRVV